MAYCAFLRYDAPTATCCKRASAEDLATDPEAYDCDTCEWRALEDALGPLDRLALTAHGWLAHPVVRDLALTPLVFDVLQLRLTPDEATGLFERLMWIHDAWAPTSPVSQGGDRDG